MRTCGSEMVSEPESPLWNQQKCKQKIVDLCSMARNAAASQLEGMEHHRKFGLSRLIAASMKDGGGGLSFRGRAEKAARLFRIHNRLEAMAKEGHRSA